MSRGELSVKSSLDATLHEQVGDLHSAYNKKTHVPVAASDPEKTHWADPQLSEKDCHKLLLLKGQQPCYQVHEIASMGHE